MESEKSGQSPWTSTKASALEPFSGGYTALSLVGHPHVGWWLAASDDSGEWRIWRRQQWESRWNPIASPSGVLPGPWQYSPGFVLVEDRVVMPVLTNVGAEASAVVWLTLRGTGEWQRLKMTTPQAATPVPGFQVGLLPGKVLATRNPGASDAELWRIGKDEIAALNARFTFPQGTLHWQAGGPTLTLLRSGLRIPGVFPEFPSASLIIAQQTLGG